MFRFVRLTGASKSGGRFGGSRRRKYCQRDADPSLGVRNVEPKPRQAVWEHGEVVRL
jgi:hypothetical protein